MRTRLALVSLTLSAFAATTAVEAQIPQGYIVTAESGTAPDAFRMIDPTTGAITEIFEPNGNFLGSASSVGIDSSGSGLLTSGGASIGGPPIFSLPLVGNTYDFNQAMGQGLQLFGQFGRIHAAGTDVLFTLRTVSTGLYRASSITSQPVQLSSLSRATDIAVIGNMAYVNSFESGQPSTIIEVDLATGTERTLGSAYSTIRSLGVFNGGLVAGYENGLINLIDIATGTPTPLFSSGLGMITAIVSNATSSQTFVSTASNQIFEITDFTTPIYSSAHTLEDFDVALVAQPVQLIYGSGCAGSSGTPAAQLTGGPALGQPYTMQVTSTQPMANVGCVVGFDRLSVDLGLIGFTGCTLLNTGIATLSTTSNGAGDASVSVTMPSMPSLAGLHFLGQFFIVDTGGMAVTLAASEGLEGILF